MYQVLAQCGLDGKRHQGEPGDHPGLIPSNHPSSCLTVILSAAMGQLFGEVCTARPNLLVSSSTVPGLMIFLTQNSQKHQETCFVPEPQHRKFSLVNSWYVGTQSLGKQGGRGGGRGTVIDSETVG